MSDAEVGLVAMGIGLTVILIGAIVYYLLYIIAYWKIFNKAGQPGWKSIIPFYNLYIQFKISWKPGMFWLTLILLLLGSIIAGIADTQDVLYLIGCLISLIGYIIILIDYFWLCKSFGHGGGYFIGFIFLPWLFALIVGFGSSRYIGNVGGNPQLRY